MSALPEQLRLCLNDLRFVGGVNDNQKLCFNKRYYVDKDWWWGSFLRTLEGERMEVSGITKIGSICQVALENYQFYAGHESYGTILLDSIVNARKGLGRLKMTYESLGKNVVANNIETSGILVLDSIIPKERKIAEGLYIPIHSKKKDAKNEVKIGEEREERENKDVKIEERENNVKDNGKIEEELKEQKKTEEKSKEKNKRQIIDGNARV